MTTATVTPIRPGDEGTDWYGLPADEGGAATLEPGSRLAKDPSTIRT